MSRALALAALVATGCTSAYLQATGRFAEAARTGTGSLAGAFDLSTHLCRDRADLAYLLPRLKAPYGEKSSFSAEPMRSRWFADQSAGPDVKVSWQDHCNQLIAADQVHRNSLEVITAYSWALTNVIGQGKYEGDDLRQVAAASSEITQSIMGGPPNMYTGAIAGIGGPLTQMTDFLLAHIVAHELNRKIGFADPSFQTILDKMLAYVNAAGELQYLDLQSMLGNVLDELEYGLGAQRAPADPVRGIDFYNFAARWEARLRYYRRNLDATKKLIQKLKEAHTSLKHAGESSGKVRDDDIRKLGGFLADVLEEADYVRTLGPGGP